MHPDIKVGGQLPDIALPDHLGNVTRLSDIAGKNPMAVVLYRGYW